MNPDQKIFLLQRQVSALQKEILDNKQLFKKRKIKTNKFLLIGGFFSLLILLGINTQGKDVQFNGDRLQPIIQQLLQLVATGGVAGMATNYFLEEKEG